MKTNCIFLLYSLLIWLATDNVYSKVYPSVQWNPLNPIFRENVTRSVLLSSKMNFVCPNEATVIQGAEHNTPKEQLYENLWFVDKASYDSCIIKNLQKVKLVKQCKDPSSLVYQSLVFNQFSPVSDGLEYKPGKDYYFIATSDGTEESLNDTSGGHCRTHNMRIKIHICSGDNDPFCAGTTTLAPSTISTTAPRRYSSTPNVTSSLVNVTNSINISHLQTKPTLPVAIKRLPTTKPRETRSSEKIFNETTQQDSDHLATMHRTGPNIDFVKNGDCVEDCDTLRYKLVIGGLLTLVICLVVLAIGMYAYFQSRNRHSTFWVKCCKSFGLKKSCRESETRKVYV